MSTISRWRVWWIPQIPMEPFTVEVKDFETAVTVTEVLAVYDLFQLNQNVKPDYSNQGGIQAWDEEEGAWMDFDDYEIEDRLEGLTPSDIVGPFGVGF